MDAKVRNFADALRGRCRELGDPQHARTSIEHGTNQQIRIADQVLERRDRIRGSTAIACLAPEAHA